MADRVSPATIARTAAPRVVPFRPVIDPFSPLPGGGGPPPSILDNRTPYVSTLQRLGGSASKRTLTYHAQGGVVPVVLGGPLPCGGRLIYIKLHANKLYLDVAFCEGPISGFANVKIGDRSSTDLHVTLEEHLGTAGDTTSTIISAIEPTYEIPEGIAHIAVALDRPTQTTGDYDPFRWQADVTGLLCYDPRSALTAFTTNPAVQRFECWKNSVWGYGIDPAKLLSSDWETMADDCDTDIDPTATTTKRWEMSLYIDTQDSFESWDQVMRAHCAAVLQFNAGQWGGFLDIARSRAEDNESNPIIFTDHGDETNLTAEVRVAYRGGDRVPTVVTVNFTDADSDYTDGSVQEPDTGPAPGEDWIERQFSLKGITTIERARRMAIYLYNHLHLDRDVTLDAWAYGMTILPGDRIGVDSRRLIPSGSTPPNSGAAAGVEECDVVSVTVDPMSDRITADLILYRDATYSDTIVTGGNPTVPPPPDPYSIPDDPTGVVAPHSSEDDYGRIEFFPALSPFQDYYEITDVYGSPAEPPVVARVRKSDALNAAGKHTAFIPAAIHGTAATGRTMEVTVKTVTAPAQRKSPGVTVTWTVGSVLTPRTRRLAGHIGYVQCLGSSADGYTWALVRTGTDAGLTKTLVDDVVNASSKHQHGPSVDVWSIRRLLMQFNTDDPAEFTPSGLLPTDATIQGVDIQFYITAGDSEDITIHVLDKGTVSNYGFATADFTKLGTTDYGSLVLPSTTNTGYYKLTLDSAADADINPAGKTIFTAKEDHDFTDTQPGNGTEYLLEASGVQLIIRYTSASEDATGTIITGGTFQGFTALTGTINGSNRVFTVPFDYIDGTHTIFIDGVPTLEAAGDYARSGTGSKTITVAVGKAPTGSIGIICAKAS